MDKTIFDKIYQNPQLYSNEYERGIAHGMMYFAEKLIWAEEYYLDARNKTNPKSMGGEENAKQFNLDMFQILNNAIQDFATKSKSWELFANDTQVKEYKNYIDKIFN